MGKLYEVHFMADSIGNNCHYQNVATDFRENQWCVRQIMDSNECTFALSEYNTKHMYLQWTRKSSCSKINPTDQFDHASVKNRYKRDIK